MPNVLVIDALSLDQLSSATYDDRWFADYQLPPTFKKLKRVHIRDIVYILSELCDEKSKLLVINVGEGGVFENGVRARQVFERVLHIARATFEQQLSINPKWGVFEDGPVLSIYSQSSAVADSSGQRTFIDRHPKRTAHVYAFTTAKSWKDHAHVVEDWAPFDAAVTNLDDAILTAPPTVHAPSDGYGIQLESFLGAHLIGSHSLEEWYSKRLTPNQRSFVDSPCNRPVRLRGAAGTGKTLSMVVKAIRELAQREKDQIPTRIAFITHSETLATEVVEGMLYALDPDRNWERGKNATLWRGSLYQLARDLLEYKKKGLQPLSLDGVEGREFQRLLVEDAVNKSLRDIRFSHDIIPRCDNEFQAFIQEQSSRVRFVELLLNEFASVIDAEGIRRGADAGRKYLTNYRDDLQMRLPSEAEREAVLYIHDIYCQDLDKSDRLSIDQMIGDFSRYLMQSAEWRQLRSRTTDRKGFDLIFVDEFHYFNKTEAAIFHNLISGPAEQSRDLLPLFMAYDLKQSPTDAGLNASSLFKATKAGETKLVELKEIFRSTPRIAAFLSDLDGSFPAYNLFDDWQAYPAQTQLLNDVGESVPTLTVFKKDTDLLDAVFANAEREAAQLGGRQVAVLCPDDELFSKYLVAGRIKDKFVPIESRDDIGELRYTRKKFVFSMPQHVAGLQFNTVYIIHVDKDSMATGATEGERRRFITRCYVSASRAIQRLQIASSMAHGGPSEILTTAVNRGSLKLLNQTQN